MLVIGENMNATDFKSTDINRKIQYKFE